MRSLSHSPSTLSEEICQNGSSRISRISPSATNGLGQDLPYSVPDCLRSLLSVTESPHEDYLSLQASRERRFRRLLRRFTNQIQYGCRNANCEVLSCLSYRKRLSSTPIRPYSDVAARALAWKCVEQYASHGREVDPTNHENSLRNNKLKRKGKTTLRKDDLCWDEPVVPWYEDPKEYFRKRDTASKARTALKSNKDKSIGSDLKRSILDKDKQLNENAVKVDSNVNSWDDQTIQNLHPQNPEDSLTSANFAAQNLDDGGTSDRVYREKPEYDRKKDLASFTQFLLDTSHVKSFDHVTQLTDEMRNEEHDEHTCVNERDTLDTNAAASVLAREPQKVEHTATGIIRPVHTFRILPASAVLWLRMKLGNEGFDSSLQHFAQCSLQFALSHPLRLIESAATWDLFWENGGKEDAFLSTSLSEKVVNDRVESLNEMQKIVGGKHLREILPSWDSVERISLALKDICAEDAVTTLSNHVFAALQHAYVTPVSLKATQPVGFESIASSSPEAQFLPNRQVSHLILLSMSIINGLATSVPGSSDNFATHDFNQFQVIHPSSFLAARGTGQVYPQSALLQMYRHLPMSTRKAMCQDYLRLTFCNGDPNFMRLSDSVADIISHRLALSEMMKVADLNRKNWGNTSIVDQIISFLLKPPVFIEDDARFITTHYSLRLLMFMQSVLLAKWDRRPVISRIGPVGGALEMLAGLYRKRQELRFESAYFQMHFIANNLDEVEMPYEWLSFRKDSKKMHILQFSFLFDPATLVKYFRAINLKVMQHAHENALAVYINAKSYLVHTLLPVYGVKEILDKVRPHMARYFVMTISRHNVLEDAINQIWRRERQELMRPLKVRVGKDEGEDGLDHGGVQQEFFRLVFAEAFNPGLGMFTTDDRTRMTWFQPGSMEPLYKFESLGVLMSLAVYNAVTLPLTLPLAFYRKLLDLKVSQLHHVEDGWPDLCRSLQTLLDWQDGDVGESIMRTYEFSFDVFGSVVTIDMQKVARDDQWPVLERRKSRGNVKTASFKFPPSPLGTPPATDSPSLKPDQITKSTSMLDTKGTSTPLSLESDNNEAELVTNANRRQYVKDYIFWLTDKSIRPQFEAFAKGFFTCLNPTALSIFTPEALKQVVEGHQDIDIDGLEKTASYDDYEVDDPVIRDFWSVVRDLPPEQHRKLLEFVTASDRVPVNGIESITFTIQKNGEGDDRLPSSSTCYGRLLLPHYSSKEILKAKIEKAIENSIGFGSL